MEKRHISAHQLVADFHHGMDDKALMEKYRLSPNGFKNLFKKLIESGLITEEEFSEFELLWAQKNGRIWRCPHCHMPQSHEFEECPQCGVIVSKFIARTPHVEGAPQACEFEFVDGPSDPGLPRPSSAAQEESLPLSSASALLCPACEANLPPDAKFCTSCGARVK